MSTQSTQIYRHPPLRTGRTGALIALGVAAAGVLGLAIGGPASAWFGGIAVGLATGLAVGARRGHRDHTAPIAEPRGASSFAAPLIARLAPERRTEQALAQLQPAGWRVCHGVRGRDGVYDHVAVGRGGVIVLHSIDPEGVVEIRAGGPFLARTAGQDAAPIVTRLRTRAVSDAAAFRDEVAGFAGRRLWVQAVVVVWSELPAGCVTDGRCMYVHGSRLAEWMTRRPQQFDPGVVDEIAQAVQRLAEAGGGMPLPLAV